MSFFGKKFRRVRCENTHELVQLTQHNEPLLRAMLQSDAPIICYTRNDDDTFSLTLTMGDKVMQLNFRFGEECVMEKRDGSKIRITYTLESDNVLNQKIILKEGKVVYFRREFGENEAKMTVTIEGSNVEARIYYKQVD